ncbi:MAG TPA: DUF1573 domain-containing protein [Pirellulaceae bacterium]|nr:DUF1573 domain-containing protein [Pirellulaceae bacterium]
MLGRTLLFLAGGLFIVGGLTIYAASNATFLYKNHRAAGARIIVDEKGARIDLDAVKAKVAAETGVHGLPRAAVPVTDYDFGTMDPMTTGVYDFAIENVGDAPLTLKQGPTSCKCTLSGLSADKLLPGQTGKVRLEWFTGSKVTRFQQTAVIYTNDPTQRAIGLGVTGKVKMLIGFDRQEVIAERVEPDKPLVKEVLLYSQVWSKFEVSQFRCSLPGVTFAAEALDAKDGGDFQPLSVQRIKITIPGTLRQGDFHDTLRFTVRPLDPEGKPHDISLALHGKVLRRLSIYGQGIDGDGAIDLGTVPRGVGKKLTLVMKVRDPQTDLNVENVRVKPEFLKASVKPHVEESAHGLYDLSLELPAEVPPCTYLGLPSGELKIDFDHPRIDDLTLEVHFAVAP